MGCLVKHFHKRIADDLALRLRIGDACQAVQKQIGGVNGLQAQVKMMPENGLHLLPFAFPQHPVVHINASELVADRLVQQHGGHGRIHTAGQAENQVGIANRLPDLPLLLVHEGGPCPVAPAPADTHCKVFDEQAPGGSMHHFGMKLYTVVGELVGRYRRNRRIAGMGNNPILRRQAGKVVAVAHPDDGTVGYALEESRGIVDMQMSAPEFAALGRSNLPSRQAGHGLQAVANTEHRRR